MNVTYVICVMSVFLAPQGRMSLPGSATGLLLRNSLRSPHRAARDSVRPLESTRTSSQTLFAMPENSTEPSHQDNAMQQSCIQRLVTQGPVALTYWYIIKVQIPGYARYLSSCCHCPLSCMVDSIISTLQGNESYKSLIHHFGGLASHVIFTTFEV